VVADGPPVVPWCEAGLARIISTAVSGGRWVSWPGVRQSAGPPAPPGADPGL